MRAVNRNSWPVWLAALIAFGVLAAWTETAAVKLQDTRFATGYIVFGLTLFLAFYNWRKKLSMIPVGRASAWLSLHIILGFLVLAAFWLHTGVLWPLGLADQALAALFYLACLSGIFGYALQQWLPGRMARGSREMIYERIPAELAAIRAEVEKAVLAAAAESGHDTLGRYYLETLAWYFARPRFRLSHVLGGRRAQHWLRSNLDTIRRYLSDAEKTQLERIAELGAVKTEVDMQFALQSVLKRWTMIHVPAATAMIALACWHLILVHVFAR